MNFEEEISLLIKSRYPLVLVDTLDEGYVMDQLYSAAEGQSFTFYSWSLTKGLRMGRNENSFYKTGSAMSMLLIANDLVKNPQNAVFTFCDFDRFLADAAVRESIIKIHLEKRGLDPKLFDVPGLARNCGGFSGAEIEQGVISALYSASGANENISSKHVLEQLKLTRPLSVIKAEAVNSLRGWAKERSILPV